MKTGIKLIAAIAAGAAVMLSAADAGAAIGGASAGSSFAGLVATNVQPQTGGTTGLPVSCKPGDVTSTSPTRLVLAMTADTTHASSVGNLANANRVKASWTGGSMWLTKVDHGYTAPKSAKFPCPATDTAPMTITYQPYRGSRKVGAAAQASIPVSYSGPRVVKQFAAIPQSGQIVLDCKPGTRVKSTAPVRLEVTRNTALAENSAQIGDDLNRATRFVASFNGGSLTLTKFDRYYTMSGGARYTCPNPAKAGSGSVTMTVQGYRGAFKVGAPARVTFNLFNKQDAGSATEASQNVQNNTSPQGTTVADPTPASASDPVQASVHLPQGVNGQVTITESGTSSQPKPNGWTFFGTTVHIEAPTASVANPLQLGFNIYAPAGTLNEKTVKIYRNGTEALACTNAGQAAPDPCVVSRTRSGDVVTLVVNTVHASDWNTAKQDGAPS